MICAATCASVAVGVPSPDSVPREMAATRRTTTYWGMTSLSFPLYSGDPATDPPRTRSLGGGPIMDNDSISGYDIPVDPMDLLQCDSCQ